MAIGFGISSRSWWRAQGGGGGVPSQLLLDEYPNAAAAYSLRDLSAAFVGIPVVRVRRSSDNTEQDFTATEITDGTLTTFTGVNDGFVTTWYDQSGNNIDVIQAAAGSQPQIVSGGALILQDGKPTVFYGLISDSAIKFLQTTAQYIIAQPTSYFSVARLNIDESSFLFDTRTLTSPERQTFLEGFGSIDFRMNSGIGLVLTTNIDTKPHLFTPIFNGISSKGFIDGVELVSGDSGASSQDWGTLGRVSTGNSYQARTISEMIIYPSDQNANRVNIETNINNHYIVVPNTPISGLLFDYPNAEAAYSLRQLTFYQNGFIPKVVQVRRSSDNVVEDFTATQITDGTLEAFVGAGNNGFVSIWYDQSGNNNNAIQTNTSAQPQIVSAGFLILENGKASIEFNGSLNQLDTIQENTTEAIFVVCKDTNLNANAAEYVIGSTVTDEGVRTSGTVISGIGVRTGTVSINSNVEDTNQHLITIDINAETVRVDANVEATGVMIPFNYNIIGARTFSSTLRFSGLVQEVISYNINQSSNITAIETNINNHYNIY